MRGTINLALTDPDDPPESLNLSATSSNRSVLPNRNISFGGGTDTSRTMTVSSLTGSGTTNVTITLSDGDQEGMVSVRVISGSASNNTLSGSTNTDMIFARKGRDTLSAQGANDLMCGGNDMLTGGVGADRFGRGSGTDTATDFNAYQGDTTGASRYSEGGRQGDTQRARAGALLTASTLSLALVHRSAWNMPAC
jgi:Ca2+-binding RTX toxin-like protein